MALYLLVVLRAGRSRWVVYSDAFGMDYDGSQVPAEWWVTKTNRTARWKLPPCFLACFDFSSGWLFEWVVMI